MPETTCSISGKSFSKIRELHMSAVSRSETKDFWRYIARTNDMTRMSRFSIQVTAIWNDIKAVSSLAMLLMPTALTIGRDVCAVRSIYHQYQCFGIFCSLHCHYNYQGREDDKWAVFLRLLRLRIRKCSCFVIFRILFIFCRVRETIQLPPQE